MKPFKYANYGSIPHLSNSKLGEHDYYANEGQEKILTVKTRDSKDYIWVFEKYDGSNVGIAKLNGEIVTLQKKGYLCTSSPFKLHHDFDKWVRDREHMFKEMLSEGERIVGEWLDTVHTIKYTPKYEEEPVVFFDYFTADNKRTDMNNLLYLLQEYDLNAPTCLHYGNNPKTVEELLPKLNDPVFNLFTLDQEPEGMIFRVERDGIFDFAAKWVRADFEAGKHL